MPLTVIIPTLLKDRELLVGLLNSLLTDKSVSEILIIKNTREDFEYNNDKVRIIGDSTNHFVNPSWNLGVKEAKTEYIALLNDDIYIPNNFCSSVLNLFTDNVGVIGIDTNNVINTRDANNNIVIDINSVQFDSKIERLHLKQITFRPPDFGIAMFLRKKDYVPIPENLKIFFGDDWIIHYMRKNDKKNFVVSGINIYHLGSLSSSSFSDYAIKERRIYVKHVYSIFKRIFFIDETCTHYVILIFGFLFNINKKYLKV